MELTGKQKRHLRGLGHSLKPVTQIGRSGVTEGVISQTDEALEDHELIKIRFGGGFEGEIAEALEAIRSRTGAAVAGKVGRTALLYRRRSEEPEIELP